MAAKNFSLHNVSPAAPIFKPKAAADGESAPTQTYRFIKPIIPAVENGNNVYVEMEVNCNAMEEAGIRYGDHIRVLRKDHCSNGQIIIALLNGQMLLRRYQTNGYQVQLVPDSPGLASIEVDTRISDFRVWGLVTHIIKKI